MTIEECYQALGGDYAGVSARLPSQRLIEKFVVKFLEDKSFEELCQYMETENRGEAFRAAHTLKGVCANLGFAKLMDSASKLTEVLRQERQDIPEEAPAIFKDVKRDYDMTVEAIRAYLGEK